MTEENHVCEECDRSFDTYHALRCHEGKTHKSKPYFDKDWLRERYIEEGKTTKDIAEISGCSESVIRDHLDNHGIRTRATGNRDGVSITEINKDVAFISGAIMSDGYASISSHGAHIVCLSVTDKPFVEEFSERLENLGFSTKMYHRDDDGRYSVSKSSVELFGVINEIKGDLDVLESDEIKREFLRGYYSGDGYLKSDESTIGLTTTSVSRKEELESLLKNLNYEFNTTSNDDGLGEKTLYDIRITQRMQIKRFTDNIGSPIERKNKDIEVNRENNNGYSWDKHEMDILRSELDNIESGIWSKARDIRDKLPYRTTEAIRQKAYEVKNDEV